MDIVKEVEHRGGYYYTSKEKFIDTIRAYKNAINELYINYDLKDKNGKLLVKENVSYLKEQCENEIDHLSSHEDLMYLVLKELDKKENRAIRNFMFEIMFGKPNETFMKMILDSKETVYKLEEDENGSEKYYDFTFKKVASNS